MFRKMLMSVIIMFLSVPFIFAYGVFKVSDVQTEVGKTEVVQMMLSGDPQVHDLQLFLLVDSDVKVNGVSGSQTINVHVEAFEKKQIEVVLSSKVVGQYEVKYVLKDTAPGMMQTSVHDQFLFTVQSAGNTSIPPKKPATTESGGGGSSGGVFTPYVAPNNTITTPIPQVQAPVVEPVKPVQAQSIDADGGVDAMQATVPDVGKVDQVNMGGYDLSGVVVKKSMNKTDLFILVLGIGALIMQALALYIVKKEEVV